jgi:8-amino-7-oxononanoate synthase
MPSDHSLLGFALRRARLAGRALVETSGAQWFVPLDDLKAAAGAAGAELISFANYDYLGLSDHPAIKTAAHAAIDRYGVGALGSRLVGGERRIHAEFEQRMAKFVGFDGCLALVSGYLTNLSLISHLMGKLDLVVYDQLSHNSIVSGVMASRADHFEFRHNDLDHLRTVLRDNRSRYQHCLIAVESLYSMDGDIVDLPGLLSLKEEFGCWLLVDEAHSIGVLGKTGRGISEHYGEDPQRIDLVVGTLSKTFASCGGFICAQKMVRDLMSYTLPGFVYSVGLPPVIAAAAGAALDILEKEPQRVAALQKNGRHFVEAATAAGLDTGVATGDAIVPVHFADMKTTVDASAHLMQHGIYAPPIVHMGVPTGLPRIRFFISARHTEAEIDRTVAVLKGFAAARSA